MTDQDSLKLEMDKIKDEYTNGLQKLLKKALKSLFSDPTIESIGWQQYTPGFNDGDPCEFTMELDSMCGIKINGKTLERVADDEGFDCWNIPKKDKKNQELLQKYKNAAKALKVIDKDAFLFAYGNDVEVTINRDMTHTIERYDCGY